jgi:hypothetical protein
MLGHPSKKKSKTYEIANDKIGRLSGTVSYLTRTTLFIDINQYSQSHLHFDTFESSKRLGSVRRQR